MTHIQELEREIDQVFVPTHWGMTASRQAWADLLWRQWIEDGASR
jgi:hypothetical protein